MKLKSYVKKIVLVFIPFIITQLQINSQTVDTIYTASGSITSIDIINENPNQIFIIDNVIGIKYTTDLGETWNAVNYNTSIPELHGISFNQINPLTGYASATEGIYKSTDGGFNWSNTNQLEKIYIVKVCPFKEGLVIAQKSLSGGAAGPIYFNSSTNGGSYWSEIQIERFILDPQFHSTNDSTIFGHDTYKVLKTTDLGVTWQNLKTAVNQFKSLAVNKNNSEILYAGEKANLYKSIDGGITWNEIGGSLRAIVPDYKPNSILLDDNNLNRIFVGVDEGLFFSDDDGVTWNKVFDGRVEKIIADQSNPRNIYLSINYGKHLVRILDTMTVTSVSSEPNQILNNYSLEQNYPNPFNPSTVINYSLKFNSDVTIKIYSTTGELAKTLVNKSQSAGNYSIKFRSTGLASGTYIYRLTATDKSGKVFSSSKKMLLIK